MEGSVAIMFVAIVISLPLPVLGKPIVISGSSKERNETLDIKEFKFCGYQEKESVTQLNIDDLVLVIDCTYPPPRGRTRNSCHRNATVDKNIQYYCMSSDPQNSSVSCNKEGETVTCACSLNNDDSIERYPVRSCSLKKKEQQQ